MHKFVNQKSALKGGLIISLILYHLACIWISIWYSSTSYQTKQAWLHFVHNYWSC